MARFIFLLLFLMLYCIQSSSTSFLVLGQQPTSCPPVMTAANIVGGTDHNSGDGVQRLRVLMPWKVGFHEFVMFNRTSCMLDGFSVQVFLKVLDRMGSRAPSIQIILHGDGIHTPSYNEMVDMVFEGNADAIAADLTVTKTRMEKVGYTVPYLPATVVMVTPFRYASNPKPWDFLKPFSRELWGTLLGFFMATGVVLFVLESKNPDFHANMLVNKSKNNASTMVTPTTKISDEAQHNQDTSLMDPSLPMMKQRFMNAYWFTSLCVFCAQQESVRTHLGRGVTLAWMLVMFIMFNASYTASLASLLSGQVRSPVVQGFQALLKNENISVGYQEGSFMRSFLQSLTISPARLKSYNSIDDFAHGLYLGSANGGVDAIIDMLPFVHHLLTRCDFIKNSIDDRLPNFGGFGFAFAKNSSLIKEVSKEILVLLENATIKELLNKWKIDSGKEDTVDCNSSQLKLENFVGLFGILACVYFICIIWHFFNRIKILVWKMFVKFPIDCHMWLKSNCL